MLYSAHYYHKHVRRYLIAFINLFRYIDVQRTDSATNVTHQERVPIMYASKEKFIQRYIADANLDKEISIKLPRMSVEIVNMIYNPDRKVAGTRKELIQTGSTTKSWAYVPVPYDIEFSLNIYTKTKDEAYQIIEQIAPFFQPDYSISVKILEDSLNSTDFPVTLTSMVEDDNFEGEFEDRRMINWTLSFVTKGFFFGPIRTTKKIRAVLTSYYDYDTNTLLYTDVDYGSNDDDIDQILDYDGESDIPGTTTPADSSAESVNNIAVERGTAISEALTIIDDEEDPVDLTGTTLRGWIRRNISSSDFRDLAISITTAASGLINVSMTAENTSLLELGSHIYEIEIDNGDGSVSRGASGTITVTDPSID